ncbi:MAG TPA: hypothetical protein VMN39_06315 [Longimicrobiaceae bacterium]|nr:hypothetical protein [Longimicrobiaceae bacterium]
MGRTAVEDCGPLETRERAAGPRPLPAGLIAGLLGGTVVAAWFFALDAAGGEPLRTPRTLAAALFETEGDPGGLVVAYTFLHFTVFAAIGVLLAELIARTELKPGLLVGALFGIFALDLVHYSALLLAGADLTALLSPVHVLASNVAAGVAMALWLNVALRPDAPIGLAALHRYPRLERGVVTGLVGAAVVAAYFVAIDVLRGQPLFTPAALGSLVFLGADGPADVQISLGVVAAYTALHLLLFTAVGIAFEAALDALQRAPAFWLVALMGFILLEGVFLGVAAVVGLWVLGAAGWWQTALANLLAVGAMGAWAWRSNPALRRALADPQLQVRF